MTTATNMLTRTLHRATFACGLALAATLAGTQAEAAPNEKTPASKPPAATAAAATVPKDKQTNLGLYVTARQAYEMWKADPDRVKIIDVRTPEEFGFIGHPEAAWNVPVAFVTYRRAGGKTEYGPQPNPDFVAEVKKLAGPQDTLLVLCRSGSRSAKAVDQLAAASFERAYNVTDGFEGDKVDDPGSVFHGKRMRNGWKNSAPWVYTVDPDRILITEGTSRTTQ
jgi:rhodanese-related sulfurtransferase